MSKPVILELLLNRMTAVMIDGQHSKHKWSYGSEGNTICVSQDERDSLVIGDHKVKSIAFDGPHRDDCDPSQDSYYIFDYSTAIIPQDVRLCTTTGSFGGKVVRIVSNQSNEHPKMIQLHDGTDYSLDEVTLYLKAELYPV